MVKGISELKSYESPMVEIVNVHNDSPLLAGSDDKEQVEGWEYGGDLE